MNTFSFPDVESANSDGIVAITIDIDLPLLINAYKNGIFPWPYCDDFIPWFSPKDRAILEFDDFRISRSMKRFLRKTDFEFRVDTDFKGVIKNCSTVKRKGQTSTWIISTMLDAYIEFHNHGFAHSFETWNSDGELVGGMYGVMIGKTFAGESMFHTESNASKFALIKSIEYLKDSGITWIDIQDMTPLLESFGGKTIPRKMFITKLKKDQVRL